MVPLKKYRHSILVQRLPYTLGLLLLVGCVSSQLVTSDMEPKIARDVTFEAMKAEPEQYKGRLVVLGGKVLGAKRVKGDGTQIEVLQLPLDKADAPTMNLLDSKGRFLAFQQEFLDPAKLPEGTAVSMIAEVTGSKTQLLDEEDYRYPTLSIQTLKVWPTSQYEYWRSLPRPYPFRYPFHPLYYPYWWEPWWY